MCTQSSWQEVGLLRPVLSAKKCIIKGVPRPCQTSGNTSHKLLVYSKDLYSVADAFKDKLFLLEEGHGLNHPNVMMTWTTWSRNKNAHPQIVLKRLLQVYAILNSSPCVGSLIWSVGTFEYSPMGSVAFRNLPRVRNQICSLPLSSHLPLCKKWETYNWEGLRDACLRP